MRVMDHDEAVRNHAAERYLLNELAAQEREDFEAHFFSCTLCADDVRTTFAFADNAKAEFSQQVPRADVQPKPMRSATRFDLFAWLGLGPHWAPMAAVLLFAVVLYQTAWVVPSLRRDLSEATAAQALPTVVARPATRGDDPVIRIASTDRFIHLVLDVTAAAASYVCEVRDSSGALLFSLQVPAPPSGDSLGLLVPTAALKSGRHAVTVRAAATGESPVQNAVDNYTFVLERN
jgi:hypothetical protein